MVAKANSTNPRSDIRRVAIRMTPLVWTFAMIGMMGFQGFQWPRAAAIASMIAIGALVAWFIYHAISRRDDGLAIFIITLTSSGTMGRRSPLPLQEEVLRAAVGVIVAILGSCIVGLFLRVRWKGGPKPAKPPL